MEDLELELKQSAITELEDHLHELSDLLNNKDVKTISVDDIDQIFRIVHSIKGNCKASGFDSIAHLSHIFESKLIKVRSGVSGYSETFHELNLLFLDNLSDALDLLKIDMDASLNFDEIYSKLESFSDQTNQNTESKTQDKLNILIIDDDQNVLEIISTYISENFNANIRQDINGQDGIASCDEQKFNAIICDYKMPKIDGKEFIKMLRSGNSINKNTPIIFLSGFRPTITGDAQTWREVFFLEKPFEEAKLVYYMRCSLELAKEIEQTQTA